MTVMQILVGNFGKESGKETEDQRKNQRILRTWHKKMIAVLKRFLET